jgi:hypothetical protein
MKAIDVSGPHPAPQPLGEIVRTFSGPGYGDGVHTDSNGGLVATYRITT